MKIIEAMKRVKANDEKVVDLQNRIKGVSAHLSIETPLYGAETPELIKGWLQSIHDTNNESVRLLVAIARTNQVTPVTITLGEANVTKTIAEWIWRRRKYAASDLATWQTLTDRGLREGQIATSTTVPMEAKIVRNYDPIERDQRIGVFKSEAHLIDAALEVINAITDLKETD